MREREDLGRVCEWHGPLTWGVEGGKEEDEEGNHAEMCIRLFRDDEAETGGKQSPCHVGEGEEKESAATPGVNGPDGRPSEDEVDETKAERGKQGVQIVSTSVDEHGRGIESDDVDTAHLLCQHDGEGSASCTSDTWNGEKFDETCDIIAFANDIGLLLNLGIDVV